MSRSGGHAIIHWMLAQAEGRTCFANCAQPWQSPFRSARPMADGRAVRASYPDFNLEDEQNGRFSRKDWLLYSYEDCFLGTVASRTFEEHREELVGASDRRVDVLILRDPFNLFASRLAWERWMRRRGETGTRLVPRNTARRIWKQHARELLGERRHLGPERVFIRYGAWVVDRDYRRQIARRLGLRFTDAGLGRVPAVAGGSSFDGRLFDRRARRMKVLDRWRRFQDDPEYLEVFDEPMIELSTRVFGEIPGTQAVIRRTAAGARRVRRAGGAG